MSSSPNSGALSAEVHRMLAAHLKQAQTAEEQQAWIALARLARERLGELLENSPRPSSAGFNAFETALAETAKGLELELHLSGLHRDMLGLRARLFGGDLELEPIDEIAERVTLGNEGAELDLEHLRGALLKMPLPLSQIRTLASAACAKAADPELLMDIADTVLNADETAAVQAYRKAVSAIQASELSAAEKAERFYYIASRFESLEAAEDAKKTYALCGDHPEMEKRLEAADRLLNIYRDSRAAAELYRRGLELASDTDYELIGIVLRVARDIKDKPLFAALVPKLMPSLVHPQECVDLCKEMDELGLKAEAEPVVQKAIGLAEDFDALFEILRICSRTQRETLGRQTLEKLLNAWSDLNRLRDLVQEVGRIDSSKKLMATIFNRALGLAIDEKNRIAIARMATSVGQNRIGVLAYRQAANDSWNGEDIAQLKRLRNFLNLIDGLEPECGEAHEVDQRLFELCSAETAPHFPALPFSSAVLREGQSSVRLNGQISSGRKAEAGIRPERVMVRRQGQTEWQPVESHRSGNISFYHDVAGTGEWEFGIFYKTKYSEKLGQLTRISVMNEREIAAVAVPLIEIQNEMLEIPAGQSTIAVPVKVDSVFAAHRTHRLEVSLDGGVTWEKRAVTVPQGQESVSVPVEASEVCFRAVTGNNKRGEPSRVITVAKSSEIPFGSLTTDEEPTRFDLQPPSVSDLPAEPTRRTTLPPDLRAAARRTPVPVPAPEKPPGIYILKQDPLVPADIDDEHMLVTADLVLDPGQSVKVSIDGGKTYFPCDEIESGKIRFPAPVPSLVCFKIVNGDEEIGSPTEIVEVKMPAPVFLKDNGPDPRERQQDRNWIAFKMPHGTQAVLYSKDEGRTWREIGHGVSPDRVTDFNPRRGSKILLKAQSRVGGQIVESEPSAIFEVGAVPAPAPEKPRGIYLKNSGPLIPQSISEKLVMVEADLSPEPGDMVMVSDDGGLNYKRCDGVQGNQLRYAAVSPSLVCFKLTNGGKEVGSPTEIVEVKMAAPVFVKEEGVDPRYANRINVVFQVPDFSEGLLYSKDEGQTWKKIRGIGEDGMARFRPVIGARIQVKTQACVGNRTVESAPSAIVEVGAPPVLSDLRDRSESTSLRVVARDGSPVPVPAGSPRAPSPAPVPKRTPRPSTGEVVPLDRPRKPIIEGGEIKGDVIEFTLGTQAIAVRGKVPQYHPSKELVYSRGDLNWQEVDVNTRGEFEFLLESPGIYSLKVVETKGKGDEEKLIESDIITLKLTDPVFGDDAFAEPLEKAPGEDPDEVRPLKIPRFKGLAKRLGEILAIPFGGSEDEKSARALRIEQRLLKDVRRPDLLEDLSRALQEEEGDQGQIPEVKNTLADDEDSDIGSGQR